MKLKHTVANKVNIPIGGKIELKDYKGFLPADDPTVH